MLQVRRVPAELYDRPGERALYFETSSASSVYPDLAKTSAL